VVFGADGRPVQARPQETPQGNGQKPSRDRLEQVARGGTLNLVGAAVAGIATVGVTVVVTRKFSPPEAGAFFTATSVFLIIEAIASLGTNVGLVYFIARLRSLGQSNRIGVIMRAAVLPVVVLAAAAAAGMILAAGPLSHLLLSADLGKGRVAPGSVATALRALALTLPFAALLDAYLGASQGYREMRPSVVLDRIGRSLGQLAGVAVAVAVGSAALLAPLWALPYVPAAVIAWFWTRRIRRKPSTRRGALLDVPPELAALLALATPWTPDQRQGASGRHANGRAAKGRPGGPRMGGPIDISARSFWRFTTPRAVASLASIILQRVDIVLVAIMKGPVEAAVYTAATRFLVAGQFAAMAVCRATQPRLTELFTVGDIRGTNMLYQATTSWLVLMTWPLYLLAAVFGPQVLAIFGHSYNAGDSVMVILALTMLLASGCGLVDVVLITSGRSSWSLWNGLLQVVVNVGLDLLLIPKYGITGAAIGWAAAIALGNLMPLAQLATVTRLHPFGKGTMVAFALTSLSFGAIPLAAHAALGGGLKSLAVSIVGGCALQAAGMWKFREPLRLAAMPGLSAIIARRSGR
jgi:O-antigen/teichoic acid export membrane protein